MTYRYRSAHLPSLALLVAVVTGLSGCGRSPGVTAAQAAVGDTAAQAAKRAAGVAMDVYYAFDDYNERPTPLDEVQKLAGDMAGALKADGPQVFLTADTQAKGGDFRTRVTPNMIWGQGFEPLGELASDHTPALRDFLTWSEKGKPAQTYLTICTHGGAASGVLWDYNGNPQGRADGHMTLQNLARAIAKGHQGARLPELNLDACMMASIEVGEALKGVTAVYTGCEDFGMGDSTPFGRLVTDVQAGRCPDGEAYGRTMVDEVINHGNWGDQGTRTLSAIRLDHHFDTLVSTVDRLAGSLIAALATEPGAIRQAVADTHLFYWMQQYTVEYGDFHQRDLIEFCQALQQRSHDAHVLADARAVSAAVPPVLVAFQRHPSETMANGLAIQLSPSMGHELALYRDTEFGRHTRWANFLAALEAASPPAAKP